MQRTLSVRALWVRVTSAHYRTEFALNRLSAGFCHEYIHKVVPRVQCAHVLILTWVLFGHPTCVGCDSFDEEIGKVVGLMCTDSCAYKSVVLVCLMSFQFEIRHTWRTNDGRTQFTMAAKNNDIWWRYAITFNVNTFNDSWMNIYDVVFIRFPNKNSAVIFVLKSESPTEFPTSSQQQASRTSHPLRYSRLTNWELFTSSTSCKYTYYMYFILHSHGRVNHRREREREYQIVCVWVCVVRVYRHNSIALLSNWMQLMTIQVLPAMYVSMFICYHAFMRNCVRQR